MKSARAYAAVCVAVALAISSLAEAKSLTPLPPTEGKPVVSAKDKPSMASKVESWTKAEWNAAKAEWAKDKAKWAGCRKRADVNKLAGRKSWSFLYGCMHS
jgi:hypothetical protein